MSTFNKRKEAPRVFNHEGSPAKAIRNEKVELYIACATNLVTNTFYETSSDNLRRIRGLVRTVASTDPLWIAKLAVYCREEMRLRTLPLILMVELAQVHNGTKIVANGTSRVIQRADELSEILAYYMQANGHQKLNKVSKQLQNGIAQAFHKFDEYQFSKYKRIGANISLRDAMFVSHPSAVSPEQEALFRRIANNELATPQTWEATQSQAGQDTKGASAVKKEAASREAWEQLISSRKIGYMACLRNLRNFIDVGISKTHVEMVYKYLTNDIAIKNSKQMPFRFYTAHREISSLGKSWMQIMFLEAIKDAGYKAMSNMALLDPVDRVLSVSDVSGSMGNPVTTMSSVLCVEVANFYSSMLSRFNKNCAQGYFGTLFKAEMSTSVINPFVVQNRNHNCGHGTQAHTIFEFLLKNEIIFDKIVIFSDLQFWGAGYSLGRANKFDKLVKEYRKKINPNMKLVLFNLRGYENVPVSVEDGQNYIVSGYTEESFSMINDLMNTSAIINRIDSVSL